MNRAATKAAAAESLLWPCVSLCVVFAIVLGVLVDNGNLVAADELARSLAVLGVAAFLVNLALMGLLPGLGRVFPVALLAVFSFGQVSRGLAWTGAGVLFAYGAMLAWPAGFHLLLRRIGASRGLAYALVAGASVAGVTGVLAAWSLAYPYPPAIDEDMRRAARAHSAPTGASAASPDIIYVVPDRYPSSRTLEREYGVDNASFYEELRARGFIVEPNARANYPRTFQSLASTLNGGYLSGYTKAYGADTADQRPVYDAIEDNVVQEKLRGRGYEFHNYGGWWEPTRLNRWADVNDQGHPDGIPGELSRVEWHLLQKTPLRHAFPPRIVDKECRRIQRQFAGLGEVGNGTSPVFVFAHLMVPHDPIVMDASGRCLDHAVHHRPDWLRFQTAYVEYLQYFNVAVLAAIDRQIARRSTTGRPLVFVIQSDEGPYPRSVREKGYNHFTGMTIRELHTKMGIINALRVPARMAGDVAPASLATPVNNWRTILNLLFGTELATLPHRSFVFPSGDRIFDFCDVTELLSGTVDMNDGGGMATLPVDTQCATWADSTP